jgi:putative endonuclease
MISPSQRFGRSAEKMAERWLQKKGYRILERNVRLGGGELDLIAQHHDTVVFIEVKGRRTEQFGGAPYAIDNRKKRQIIKLASWYLSRHGLSNQFCRFDVILVTGTDQESPKLTHVEQAFEVSSSEWQW